MPTRSPSQPFQPLAFVGSALLFLLMAGLLPTSPTTPDLSPLLRPTTGLALVLVLLGGKRLTASVLVGAMLMWLLAPTAPAVGKSVV